MEVDQNSINHTFLHLEISPTNHISRKSWDLGDFVDAKIFWFLMPFCNQNDLQAKYWILAKIAHWHIFYGKNRKTSNYFERFFSERGLSVFRGLAIVFDPYHSKKSIFLKFCWCMLEKFFQKSIFFDFIKYALNRV